MGIHTRLKFWREKPSHKISNLGCHDVDGKEGRKKEGEEQVGVVKNEREKGKTEREWSKNEADWERSEKEWMTRRKDLMKVGFEARATGAEDGSGEGMKRSEEMRSSEFESYCPSPSYPNAKDRDYHSLGASKIGFSSCPVWPSFSSGDSELHNTSSCDGQTFFTDVSAHSQIPCLSNEFKVLHVHPDELLYRNSKEESERGLPLVLDETTSSELPSYSESTFSSISSVSSSSNAHSKNFSFGLSSELGLQVNCYHNSPNEWKQSITQSQPLYFPEPSDQLRRSKSEPNSESPSIQDLIDMMASEDDNERRFAVGELRILTKSFTLNRMQISDEGGIPPLIDLLQSPDPATVELAVITIHNLSLTQETAIQLVQSGVSEPLTQVLENGSQNARENAAAAIFQLTSLPLKRRLNPSDQLTSLQLTERLTEFGVIKRLLNLLPSASLRGMKDSCLALFNLCSEPKNLTQTIDEGGVKILLECLDTPFCFSEDGEHLVEKITSVLTRLAKRKKGLDEIYSYEGLEKLESIIETLGSSQRSKDDILSIFLHFAKCNEVYLREIKNLGIKLTLQSLSNSKSLKTKAKALELLQLIQ